MVEGGRPAAPPTRANSTLSVRSCRVRRPRVAPREMRSAISLVRPAERASSKLATLVQAIRSTSPTAPNNSNRRVRSVWLISQS